MKHLFKRKAAPIANLDKLSQVRGARLSVNCGAAISAAAGNQQITIINFEEYNLEKNQQGQWNLIHATGSNMSEITHKDVLGVIPELKAAALILRSLCEQDMKQREGAYVEVTERDGLAAVERALARKDKIRQEAPPESVTAVPAPESN